VKEEEQASIGAASPIGVGLVLGIAVVVLIVILAVIDVSCYFVNSCGLTSFICLKVCGRSIALSKEKAAEEGER
jgi:neural cell adhesion molecule